jgi:AcrR family transcriptional regulator
MGHIERRRKEKEKIRKTIMDTALEIAISEGWNSVTIRKIALRIEYTPPIIYEHFKNKDDLFNELVLMGHRMLNKGYDLARQSESDPRKILLLLSVNHWDFAFKYKELYQLMFNFSRPIPNDEIEKLVARIENLFFELTSNRELARELIFNWICLINGFIYNTMQMGLPSGLSKIPPKDLFINAIERFLKGI